MSLFWNDMLLMDRPVPVEAPRPLVPPQLELDTFEDYAWVGWVPFRLSEFRGRYLPALPGVRETLQLNLRTYVSLDGKPGGVVLQRGLRQSRYGVSGPESRPALPARRDPALLRRDGGLREPAHPAGDG